MVKRIQKVMFRGKIFKIVSPVFTSNKKRSVIIQRGKQGFVIPIKNLKKIKR